MKKKIHYCWFGGNQLPEEAQKCIESWKKYFPEYEIKEWNESNFDVNCCTYVRQAYQNKKWAFVSDYARFWILYHEGGLYFDTDVEIIKSFSDIIGNGPFIGCEMGGEYGTEIGINPGLGIGAEPGMALYKKMLEFYESIQFVRENGQIDTTTVVEYTTNIMKQCGWRQKNELQIIGGITVYPAEYFCPINYITGEKIITDVTHSIHHYTASWHSKYEDNIVRIGRFFVRHFGTTWGKRIADSVSLPYRIKNKIDMIGLKKTVLFIIEKVKKV